MADKTNTIETVVKIDSTGAQQEIIKLNATATDGTKDLETQLAAKNKQVELQNELSKQSIKDAKQKLDALKKAGASTKEIETAQKKLNATTLKATKFSENGTKQQNKMNASLNKGKGATNKLDTATGGLITKLKLLAVNPIVLFLTIVTGALLLLKEAFTSSEEGQNKFAKGMAVVGALLGNLLDLVADVADFLVDAFTDPVQAIKDFANVIKTNITNRFEGLMELIPQLGKAVSALFRGDFGEAAEIAADAVGKVALGVDGLTEKVKNASKATKEFIADQKREAGLAAQVADMRAKADKVERKLLVDRSVLESKIAQLRLDAKKEDDFSDKQRREFLIEAASLQDSLIDKETEYLVLRRDAQVLENTFSRSNKENLNAEAAAIAAVNDQIGNRAVKAKKLQTEINSINNQIRADDLKTIKAKEKAESDAIKLTAKNKKIADDAAAKKKIKDDETDIQLAAQKIERLRKQGLDTLDLEAELATMKLEQDLAKENLSLSEIAIVKEKHRVIAEEKQTEIDQLAIDNKIVEQEAEIENLLLHGENTLAAKQTLLDLEMEAELAVVGLTADEKLAIEKKYAKEKKDLDELTAKAKKESVNISAKAGIEALASEFGFAKEVALANMLIAAPQAIGNSFKKAAEAYPAPLSIAMGALGAAQTVVPIISAVKQIQGSKLSKGKNSGGGGGRTPRAPSPVSVTSIDSVASANAARLGENTGLNSSATADAANGISGASSPNIVFSENAYNDFQNQVTFVENQTEI